MRHLAIASLLFAVLGCSGGSGDDDDDIAGDANAPIDATLVSDALFDDSGIAVDGASSFECGAATCNSGEVCVHPCNCGVPACEPIPDSGLCPEGLSIDYCPGSGDEMCVGCPPPPPPVCRPRPSGCAGELSCDCVESDPCAEWGSCGFTDGAVIECLCA